MPRGIASIRRQQPGRKHLRHLTLETSLDAAHVQSLLGPCLRRPSLPRWRWRCVARPPLQNRLVGCSSTSHCSLQPAPPPFPPRRRRPLRRTRFAIRRTAGRIATPRPRSCSPCLARSQATAPTSRSTTMAPRPGSGRYQEPSSGGWSPTLARTSPSGLTSTRPAASTLVRTRTAPRSLSGRQRRPSSSGCSLTMAPTAPSIISTRILAAASI